MRDNETLKAYPFFVRVTRYFDDGKQTVWGGKYISAVYEIDIERNRFLVYDPGEDGFAVEGFKWVNFLEDMRVINGKEEDREPVVELWEETER